MAVSIFVFFCSQKNSVTMPRYKTQKASASPNFRSPNTVLPQEAKVRSPDVVLRRSRRATLVGPAQLFSKQSFSPVVMLEGNVMRKIKKALSNAGNPKSKTPEKPTAKKTGGKRSPKATKASPKSTKEPSSPRRSRRAPAKFTPKLKSPKQLKSTKLESPKKKLESPKKKAETLKKKSVSLTRKPMTPKKTSDSPKAKPETSSRRLRRRSPAAASPKPTYSDKTETQSTRNAVTASRKRKRSASPTIKKKAKVTASPQKSSAVRASEKKSSPKLARKRKQDTVIEEEAVEGVSPPHKKKLMKSESRPATKKMTSNKVSNVSFTEVKSKAVAPDLVKPGATEIPSGQLNSTPLKPKLAENDISVGWNMSGIRKKLLDSITLYRVKSARETPASSNARSIKSALFSGKKTDNPTEKRTTCRQSVRFLVNGKAGTVKEVKQRSYRKRLCYRMFQFLLLVGLPAAVTIGSVLVYNGLI